MKKIPRIVGVKGKEEEEIIGIIEEKDLTSALKSTKILKNLSKFGMVLSLTK